MCMSEQLWQTFEEDIRSGPVFFFLLFFFTKLLGLMPLAPVKSSEIWAGPNSLVFRESVLVPYSWSDGKRATVGADFWVDDCKSIAGNSIFGPVALVQWSDHCRVVMKFSTSTARCFTVILCAGFSRISCTLHRARAGIALVVLFQPGVAKSL